MISDDEFRLQYTIGTIHYTTTSRTRSLINLVKNKPM